MRQRALAVVAATVALALAPGAVTSAATPIPIHNDDSDLTGAVPAGDEIISALPDWSGRYRFASINGVMGSDGRRVSLRRRYRACGERRR